MFFSVFLKKTIYFYSTEHCDTLFRGSGRIKYQIPSQASHFLYNNHSRRICCAETKHGKNLNQWKTEEQQQKSRASSRRPSRPCSCDPASQMTNAGQDTVAQVQSTKKGRLTSLEIRNIPGQEYSSLQNTL